MAAPLHLSRLPCLPVSSQAMNRQICPFDSDIRTYRLSERRPGNRRDLLAERTVGAVCHMNYRGSYKKLLGNSQAAMTAAIEIYNKPMFQYRDECTIILLLNAWELALKALLSKNRQSIFYPKKRRQAYRTLSWQDALSRGERYLPKTISQSPIRQNLNFLSTYRDNAVHFYNSNDFGLVLHALAQTSIINYRDLIKDSFQIDLASRISWQLLPIGIRPPIDVVSYISGKFDAKMTLPVRHFLSELARAAKDLKDSDEDTGRFMTVFNVKLESVKKIGEADVLVAIAEGEAHDGPLAFVRTQDPNKSHPLREKEVLEKFTELHGRQFTSHTFRAIVWNHDIKKKSRYCWRASEGILTRYSHDLVAFIKRLSADDIDTSLSEYNDFLRHKRITRSQKR